MAEELPSEHPLFMFVPLRWAVVFDENAGSDWIEAMPYILARWPGVDYWNLTVAEGLSFLKAMKEPEEGSDANP